MVEKKRLFFGLAVSSMAIWIVTCSPSYRDASTASGAQAIIDQANNDLTAGQCDAAINVLDPLVHGPNVSYDALMVEASAYACKGGVSFTNLIGNMSNSGGQDIWGTLIRSDPSNGLDGHLSALDQAFTILYQTAKPSGYLGASQRTGDANVYMIYLQATAVATVIAPLGNANLTTGKKGNSITGTGQASDWCHLEVAFAQITDSLNYVQAGSSFSTLSSSIKTVCTNLAGGECPGNEDYTACMNATGGTYQLQGQALLIAIDQDWN